MTHEERKCHHWFLVKILLLLSILRLIPFSAILIKLKERMKREGYDKKNFESRQDPNNCD